ncbi:MAG: hypothetical protein M1832_000118 [Thelocarpon impressellum]|nr:MAG: hypothetical protein M1832_000118 [Thelocarpon impressellum]
MLGDALPPFYQELDSLSALRSLSPSVLGDDDPSTKRRSAIPSILGAENNDLDSVAWDGDKQGLLDDETEREWLLDAPPELRDQALRPETTQDKTLLAQEDGEEMEWLLDAPASPHPATQGP